MGTAAQADPLNQGIECAADVFNKPEVTDHAIAAVTLELVADSDVAIGDLVKKAIEAYGVPVVLCAVAALDAWYKEKTASPVEVTSPAGLSTQIDVAQLLTGFPLPELQQEVRENRIIVPNHYNVRAVNLMAVRGIDENRLNQFLVVAKQYSPPVKLHTSSTPTPWWKYVLGAVFVLFMLGGLAGTAKEKNKNKAAGRQDSK